MWLEAVHEYRWRAALFAAALVEHEQEVARAARESHHTRTTTRSTSRASASYGSGRCGGDLPPCYIMMRESGGSLTAQNPNSTASGKWQFLDSTWHSVTGLPGSASDYDEATQDAAARELWNGGAGAGNWACC